MSRVRSFADRRSSRTPQQLRADWVQAVDLAGALAQTAAEPAVLQQLTYAATLTSLKITLRDLAPDNFPVAAESARTMAAAFLKLARDFCHPAWSAPARTACAPFLQAGARCLDGLITNLRTEEARGWRGQLGERDED